MNKDDLYKSMNGISDEILERSEQNMLPVPDAGKTKRKYFSIAASTIWEFSARRGASARKL